VENSIRESLSFFASFQFQVFGIDNPAVRIACRHLLTDSLRAPADKPKTVVFPDKVKNLPANDATDQKGTKCSGINTFIYNYSHS